MNIKYKYGDIRGGILKCVTYAKSGWCTPRFEANSTHSRPFAGGDSGDGCGAAGEGAREFLTKSRERLKARALGFVYILLVFGDEINESCRVHCAARRVRPQRNATRMPSISIWWKLSLLIFFLTQTRNLVEVTANRKRRLWIQTMIPV